MTVYANGRAPESALTIVDGVHVVPSIASRLRAFIAYAAGQGHVIHIVRLGGYCTLLEQAERQRAASADSSISVATPGFSTHGIYGVGRVDLVGANGHSYTTAELDWMVANAGNFGLIREFGGKDPNHFMESGSFANVGPVTTLTAEENMSISFVRDPTSGTIFVCSLVSGNRAGIQSLYHYGLLQTFKAGGPMSPAELDICRSYIITINPAPVVAVPAIPPVTVAPAAIEAGVRAAFASAKTTSEGKVTL